MSEKVLHVTAYESILKTLLEPFALHEIIRDEEGCPIDFRFIDVNPSYEKVMRRKRINVVGKTFQEVWPNPEELWMDNMLETAKSGHSRHFEGYSRETDRYLHALFFPVNSNVIGVLFLDLTQYYQSEEALDRSQRMLLKYSQELQSLVTRLSLTEEGIRRTIAREIHDQFGYSFVTVMNNLKQIRKLADEDEAALSKVNNTINILQDIIDDARELTFQISSPILYEVGLGAAIKDLGERLFEKNNIHFTYRGKVCDQGIDDNVTVLLFQIVRELFVNVIKHAQATKVSATLRRTPRNAEIVVDDNGIGFEKNNLFLISGSNHFGLFSIKERLNYIGGTVEILSEPGKGSTILVSAPANTTDLQERKVKF